MDANSQIGGFERPSTSGSVCATPTDAKMIDLLGPGGHFEGLEFTKDQVKALGRFYGFDFKVAATEAMAYAEVKHTEAVQAHAELMADPDIPNWQKQDDGPAPLSAEGAAQLGQFAVSGSGRNMFRAVREDGMRVMAALSRFLEQGEDPVRLVLQLLIENNYDVSSDVDWAHGVE